VQIVKPDLTQSRKEATMQADQRVGQWSDVVSIPVAG
jgi:hypothetical protein